MKMPVAVTAALLLLAGAYLLGRWPERARRLVLEGETVLLKRRVEEADSRARLCTLLGRVQAAAGAVERKSYVEAQGLAARFFDEARDESRRTTEPAARQALEAALDLSEGLTAALARRDPSALEALVRIEARLQVVLGHTEPAIRPLPDRRPGREDRLRVDPGRSGHGDPDQAGAGLRARSVHPDPRRPRLARRHQLRPRRLQHDPRLSPRRRPSAARPRLVGHWRRPARDPHRRARRPIDRLSLHRVRPHPILRGSRPGGLWIAFIGWFLLTAAGATYGRLQMQQSLRGLRVADVMQRDCARVAGETRLQEVVDDLLRTGRRGFIVTDGGGVIGLVTPHEIKEVPRPQWAEVPAARAMRPLERLRVVAPDSPVAEAFEIMAKEDVHQLPVVAGGRLEGVIGRGDVLRALRIREELGV